MIVSPSGVIGCAFYEFGPKLVTPKIDVLIALSLDGGQTFGTRVVTDQPWDPKIDAPLSHGDPNVTFIGDYFGLDASHLGFYPLWTDTRTGIQELFTNSVKPVLLPKFDPNKWAIVAQILFGVSNDGGGAIRIGGHIIPIDPWDPDGPIRDILFGLATYQLAGGIVDAREAHALQRAALASVARIVDRQAGMLGAGAAETAHVAERIGNGEQFRIPSPTATTPRA